MYNIIPAEWTDFGQMFKKYMPGKNVYKWDVNLMYAGGKIYYQLNAT